MLNELTNQVIFLKRKNVRPREGQSHEHDKVKGSRQDRSEGSHLSKLLNSLYLFSFIQMLFPQFHWVSGPDIFLHVDKISI